MTQRDQIYQPCSLFTWSQDSIVAELYINKQPTIHNQGAIHWKYYRHHGCVNQRDSDSGGSRDLDLATKEKQLFLRLP